MSLFFSSKARTLNSLQGQIKSARIAPMRIFTVADWKANHQKCLMDIKSDLGSDNWIVRSSCMREDGIKSSNAGAFLTILNVNEVGLEGAVSKVITSYGDVNFNDEVLIQPMLKHVMRSGVAFSHDPNICAPYRVVNWSEGEDTNLVTGGFGGRIWQQAANSKIAAPSSLVPIMNLLEELLDFFGNVPLDFEFAVTRKAKKDTLWLLQVRPLILHVESESELKQFHRIKKIENKVEGGMSPHPFLMGRKTVYGVMPDWNPAEIIGIRPKPLSLSLYRELVTDSIWAYQRHNYGYRNLRSFPLMLHFFGLPYIDVRVSFNSFIPLDLEKELADRLVDYYIDHLIAEPALHDKVEFEIVFSCYTLDLRERLEKLADDGFTKEERVIIANSLRKLTNRIISPKNSLLKHDAGKLDTLNFRRDKLVSSMADPIERLYWLLEDAKRYGTLPFAGLARAGFIAIQMLRSLISVGVFTHSDYDDFLRGVPSITSQINRDRDILDKETFLLRYGHLRPGTYDIESPRYDERPDLYFDWSKNFLAHEPIKSFSPTLSQAYVIKNFLDINSLETDTAELFNFIKFAIQMRELSKFHFTRNLSDALALISGIGNAYGFSKEDLAYADINIFKEINVAAIDIKGIISKSIDEGKARYKEDTSKIALPPLIVNPADVWAFEWPENEPNFITQKQVTALIVNYDKSDQLPGAIVCLPNADPGFDWLFSYPIAGLITAWGGANSHMAIRAGEIGLPAVIGAGELLYKRWSKALRVHINCANRRVDVLA